MAEGAVCGAQWIGTAVSIGTQHCHHACHPRIAEGGERVVVAGLGWGGRKRGNG